MKTGARQQATIGPTDRHLAERAPGVGAILGPDEILTNPADRGNRLA